MTLRLCLLLAPLAVGLSASAPAAAAPAAVRATAPIDLAAYVVDFAGRAPIGPAEAEAATSRAAVLCESLFGLRVRIRVAHRVRGEAAFDRHVPPAKRLDRSAEPTGKALETLERTVRRFLASHTVHGLEELVPVAGSAGGPRAIVDRYFIARRAVQRSLGQAALSTSARALQYLGTWDRLMRSTPAWDLLLTAAPVLYSVDDGSALHALLRGGVIGGFTLWTLPDHRCKGSAMVSTYPLDSTDPPVEALRGRPPLTGADRVETTACLLAHELGHMILKLPDNYTHENCLMRPPLDLRYFEWGRAVAPPGCLDCRRRIQRGGGSGPRKPGRSQAGSSTTSSPSK